jgi:hypothetical protein
MRSVVRTHQGDFDTSKQDASDVLERFHFTVGEPRRHQNQAGAIYNWTGRRGLLLRHASRGVRVARSQGGHPEVAAEIAKMPRIRTNGPASIFDETTDSV